MKPFIFNLGPAELLIILAIVLLLFGGARLAGIGKSTGRAIKEFKEETRALKESDGSTTQPNAARPSGLESDASYPPYPAQGTASNPPPGEPRRDT